MFQPPRGMRDFGPGEMIRRLYITESVRDVFTRYGFDAVCTPGIESWELLSAKGGGGEAIKEEIYYFRDKSGREMGLRFDLTTSLARFVSANPQIPKPFKAYQIGRVWRYDRPQAGRYREFWQADADIIGSSSMACEAELLSLASECLEKLGFEDFVVRLNSRKILNAVLEFLGVGRAKAPAVFRALDKLSKTGEKAVLDELKKSGVKQKDAKDLLEIAGISGKPGRIAEEYMKSIGQFEEGKEGLEEVREIEERMKAYSMKGKVILDFSLVRGLDYYTGSVFEIALKGKESIGSVSGGGRYDSLIERLGGRYTPAVGISLGIERIAEVMKERGRPELPRTRCDVFVTSVSGEFWKEAVRVASELRRNGISAETDLMGRNIRKQLEHADRKGIPYAVIVGEKEAKSKRYVLKDMKSGVQARLSLSGIVKKVGKVSG